MKLQYVNGRAWVALNSLELRVGLHTASTNLRVQKSAGKDALQVLQRGSLLRKKWLGNSDAAEAQQSQKTERLIRCRVENNRVVLHYYHQVCPCTDQK